MLSVPSASTDRFTRSLYDVDRTQPSPFRWQRRVKQAGGYVRRMGLVESFFNTMATLHEGRTDIFYRIPLSCPAHAYDQLVRRLPLVWAILCRRHPLLSAYVETLTPDGSKVEPEDAASRRHAGEAAQDDASSSFEPHFLFDLPETATKLIEEASQRVVFAAESWSSDLDASSRLSRDEAVIAWLDRFVWNGKRRFLQQHTSFGLARLILLPPLASSSNTDGLSFDLVLCTAHCISDGLSISSLAGELLQLLASPQLPNVLPKLSHQEEVSSEVSGATKATYTSVTAVMSQAVLDDLYPGASRQNDAFTEAHFDFLLPPPIEASYPELLPTVVNLASSPASRLARLRWFWTIRRVVCQNRAASAGKAVLSDFKANRIERTVKEPWWGAQTKWSVVRLSVQDTAALTKLAKQKGVRVGSLLYAVATLALNTLESADKRQGSLSEEPTATVIGFPFSIRRFLNPTAATDLLQNGSAPDALLPPSGLGVQLGFNGVVLPPAKLFSLPTNSVGRFSAFQVAQLWQTARQVQRQFNDIFAEPRFMCADGFLTALERELRFRRNGVKDVFEVFKDDEQEVESAVAGEDERRPGLTKKNMQGPGSSLNFSMVGLLDPVLPSKLDLPYAGAGSLEVRENLMFGVRTRAGEAFGTSFTFRGQLNLELGHDTVVWDTSKIEAYLDLMKGIVESMIAFEQGK